MSYKLDHLIETPAFFPLLSIKENLQVMGKFRSVPKEISKVFWMMLDYWTTEIKKYKLLFGNEAEIGDSTIFFGKSTIAYFG